MFEQTVDGPLLRLIEKLPGYCQETENFCLAGGTALALRLGHRKSEDLDFFSPAKFDGDSISRNLLELKNSKLLSNEAGTLKIMVDDVSISFFHYPYKLLKKPDEWKSLKIASIEDILCMKIIAISQRAEKKDYFDLYEILKIHSPLEIREMLIKKYGANKLNCYHILKSIFYFEDAESSPDPISLNGTSWKKVKTNLGKMEKTISSEFIKCQK